MNFIRNRNFRAGPQTSLEGFICPQNSDKQQKIKVFGRSGGVYIGNNCFFNNYCTLASRAGITIGEGTIFGENVKVYDHNHCYKDVNEPIKYQGYTEAPIVIGKHCWIASNVVILKGVKIGDNCVIGAGCVVYKDVPEGTVMIKK